MPCFMAVLHTRLMSVKTSYAVLGLFSSFAFSTMDFIPCALFLDGEYWGMYYITENYNRDYISSHYQVEEDNVIMIKNGELAEGEGQEGKLFEEMVGRQICADIYLPETKPFETDNCRHIFVSHSSLCSLEASPGCLRPVFGYRSFLTLSDFKIKGVMIKYIPPPL